MKLFLLLCLYTFSANAQNYFSKNYETARAQFRELSEKIKNNNFVENGKVFIPSQIDSDLTMDYVYVHPQESYENLLILTSGVHGPEGFTGSAIQSSILDKKLTQEQYRNTGVLILHALNPYGFKYKRRVTENNVDLNRNFDVSDDIFNTVNEGYDTVKYIIERKDSVKNLSQILSETFVQFIRLLFSGYEVGGLVQAVGQGQYHSSEGLYYGGTEFEPQVTLFSDLIEAVSDKYKRVGFIDFHTGIGKKAELTLMSGRLTNDSAWEQILEYFPVKNSYYKLYNGNQESFFYIFGDIVDLVTMKLGSKVVFSFTAEYGTVGDTFVHQVASINRMITERAGFYNGYQDQKIQNTVEKKFLELFYPQSQNWQKSVLLKGMKLYDQAIAGFEGSK